MKPDSFTELHTPRLLLRRLQASDADLLSSYRSLPEVARYQSWESYDTKDAAELIAQQENLDPDTSGTWFQLAIVVESTGRLIGDCGLHFSADDPRQVELGITLSPASQHQGFAAEALGCVLDYLFVTLKKHRVVAITDARNHAAAALFRRLGFRQEGHFIEHVWFKGAYGSEYLFALLDKEWRAH